MAKKYTLYEVLAGCEDQVVWAKPSDKRPKGNYPLNECTADELEFLFEEIGQRQSITKVEMEKESYDLYMGNKKKPDKGKPKK